MRFSSEALGAAGTGRFGTDTENDESPPFLLPALGYAFLSRRPGGHLLPLRPRRPAALPSLLAPALLLAGLAAAAGGHLDARLAAEAALRPAPNASGLSALLTAGTPVTVLERRDGWARVRIEGWVVAEVLSPGPPWGPADAGPAGEQPADASGLLAPSERSARTGLEGRIRVPSKLLRKRSLAGARVWLVPEREAASLLAPPAPQDGEEAAEDARLAALEAEAARLRAEAAAAMHDDSFSAGTTRRDRLMKERATVLDERTGLLARRHARREASARRRAVDSAEADARGWFAFSGVPPGRYVLYARLSGDAIDLEWIRPVDLTAFAGGAGDPVRVDLDAGTAHGLPAGR